MEERTQAQRQITAAILQLRMRSPFFATLALFARISLSNTISTAATDGRDIFINPEFWEGLTLHERLGLLLHEVLHAALLHVQRRGTRDPFLWNVAADIVVNGMILAQKEFVLPQGHIRDKKHEHLSVEEIYHLIQGHICTHKLPAADLLESEDITTDYERLRGYWQQAIQQAQVLSETLGYGTLTVGLQRELTQLSPAQIDWRSYLWRFLVQTPHDFQDFDRRFIGQGLYLETLTGETVHVYVAVDTSGSIGTKEIALFLSEVSGILHAYPHLLATLYYVDAACHGPYDLTAWEEVPQPVGGRGTDFRPFFEAITHEQPEHEAAVCVYLTDGNGTFPAEAPALPTLWVLSPGGIALDAVPFGEAIRLIPEAS